MTIIEHIRKTAHPSRQPRSTVCVSTPAMNMQPPPRTVLMSSGRVADLAAEARERDLEIPRRLSNKSSGTRCKCMPCGGAGASFRLGCFNAVTNVVTLLERRFVTELLPTTSPPAIAKLRKTFILPAFAARGRFFLREMFVVNLWRLGGNTLKVTAILFGLAALAASASVSAKGTGYLFISTERDHSVTVIDSKTFEVVKNITTGKRPRDMQWNADKTLLYVGASDANRIDIIDVAKLEVVDYVIPGDDPDQFAITADGKILIAANEDENLATFVDIENDEIIGVIHTGVEPEGVSITADGKRAYITAEVSQMIHVVEMETREVLADILVGSRPRRAFFTADGKEYWVTNEISGYVSIIDTEKLEVVGELHFAPPGVREGDISPVGIVRTEDGKTAFITLGHANRLAVVDIPSREVRAYLVVGTRAWNVDFSGDGKILYVVNSGSDDVTIVDVEREKVIRTFPVGRYPHAIRIDD